MGRARFQPAARGLRAGDKLVFERTPQLGRLGNFGLPVANDVETSGYLGGWTNNKSSSAQTDVAADGAIESGSGNKEQHRKVTHAAGPAGLGGVSVMENVADEAK